jgi:medium-chain acyl-[acyl-carrier-protein] hydrolase
MTKLRYDAGCGDPWMAAAMNSVACRGVPASAQARFDDLVICHWPNPNARLRVFCFPFAGGGASTFSAWPEELPADIRAQAEFCAVQLPGRETNMRASPFDNIAPMLDVLVPAIERHPRTPFAFLGHSMGALISFELARRLRRQGLRGPIHMVVSGHRAPQLPDRRPPIHELPDQEFMAKLRNFGGTPEAVLQNPELMELMLPVLRADFAVCESYVHASEEPLGCPITAFGGNDDSQVDRDELAGWHAQTINSFSMHMFPGAHFFIQSAQVLVLRVLAQDLKQVLRRLPSG